MALARSASASTAGLRVAHHLRLDRDDVLEIRAPHLIEQDVPSLEPLAHHFEIVLQLLHASLRVLRAERPRHTLQSAIGIGEPDHGR